MDSNLRKQKKSQKFIQLTDGTPLPPLPDEIITEGTIAADMLALKNIFDRFELILEAEPSETRARKTRKD